MVSAVAAVTVPTARMYAAGREDCGLIRRVCPYDVFFSCASSAVRIWLYFSSAAENIFW